MKMPRSMRRAALSKNDQRLTLSFSVALSENQQAREKIWTTRFVGKGNKSQFALASLPIYTVISSRNLKTFQEYFCESQKTVWLYLWLACLFVRAALDIYNSLDKVCHRSFLIKFISYDITGLVRKLLSPSRRDRQIPVAFDDQSSTKRSLRN